MNRKRIAVIAYALSPTRGSEFAQGWNYINNLAKDYDVTVFVGSSGGRMGDMNEIENISLPFRILKIRLKGIQRILPWLDIKLGIKWSFVYALRSWNCEAVKELKSIHQKSKFDLLHHLGPVGFKTPSSIYKLDIPSYWGPIGGFQFIKLRLALRSGVIYCIKSIIRNYLTLRVAKSKNIGNAIKGYKKVSFATETNRNNFYSLYGVDGDILSDQGVRLIKIFNKEKKQLLKDFEIIWCGSLDRRKNIKLLIDISRELKKNNINCLINIVGTGSLERWTIKQIEKHCLNIKFWGLIKRSQVEEIMQKSKLILFTSLSEANTSTFFEGLEAICIPISLRLDGFTTNINKDIGYTISADLSYREIINEYTIIINRLINNESLINLHQTNILNSIEKYSWKCLYEKHKKIIDELLLSNK